MNRVLEALSRRPFAVIGHRGAAGLVVENTLSALRKALEARADLAEFDVQVTCDGVPVLSHDEDLYRIAGVRVSVRASTFPELKAVELPGGERIASLAELLAECSGRIPLLIEVKHVEDTRRVVEVVRRENAVDYVAIISFHDEALRIARSVEPRLPTGLIYARPPGRIVDAKKIGCSIVLPKYMLATDKAVALAHRLGLRVVAWTVNDVSTAGLLARRGVDGIATDYPDKLAELRDRLGTSQG